MDNPRYEYKTYGTAELWNLENPEKAIDIKESKDFMEIMFKRLKKNMEKTTNG